MTTKRAKSILCLIFALLTSICALAQSASLIQRVDDHYNHLRTLRARYTEHYTGMGLDRTESGTLLLRKPGLMRWSYDTPAGKVFVLDGHNAWFYTPGDAQVSRTPAKQLDDLRSPLRLLLGHTQLAKELDRIAVTASGPPGAEGQAFIITGVPKGMAERVRMLTLTVTPTGEILGMKIEETDGATTDFTFTQIEEDHPIAATAFTFTPPPGVSIVDGQSPM
jgi:outer membrane lipoprotein carrier protein